MERTTNYQVSHGGELRGTYKNLQRLQNNIFDSVGNEETADNTPFPYGLKKLLLLNFGFPFLVLMLSIPFSALKMIILPFPMELQHFVIP
jgi:hypothetical protein